MERFPYAVSIVIPVYNSESTLEALCRELTATLMNKVASLEIIAVDDGSQDGSWGKLKSLTIEYPHLHAYQLARNYGQHNALLCGVRQANGEVVITIDDDLQHPPEEIPKLLTRLALGYDVVYGAPQTERQAAWRLWPSLLPKYIQARVLGVRRAYDISAFRAFRTNLRDAFASYDGPSPILDVLLSWGGRRFDSVAVRHEPRSLGRSNYSIVKLYQAAWLMVTEFTLVPLRLVMLLGLSGATTGLLIFSYTLWIYFTQGSMPGFPFLASTIALFSSAQLIALGTLGEYLARVHLRLTGKPAYTIKTSLSSHDVQRRVS